MKFPEVELPCNRKFGFFFSFVFLIVAAYFLYIQSLIVSSALLIVSLIFLVTALFNADLLLPFNKIWTRFGLLLGMIISPIVMAVIFFGLITPYGIVMRIMGRDALFLKRTKNMSYWIIRSQSQPQTDFKQQF
jgi:hypothetical protein